MVKRAQDRHQGKGQDDNAGSAEDDGLGEDSSGNGCWLELRDEWLEDGDESVGMMESGESEGELVDVMESGESVGDAGWIGWGESGEWKEGGGDNLVEDGKFGGKVECSEEASR